MVKISIMGVLNLISLEEAISLAKSIEDDYLRSEALRDVVSELVRAGRFEDAVETARSIVSVNFRLEALMNIASGLFKIGERKKAEKCLRKQ